MDAIIYTSNTGYTAEYAELLAKELDLPTYSLTESMTTVSKNSDVIYMG